MEVEARCVGIGVQNELREIREPTAYALVPLEANPSKTLKGSN
jgi:hypothetical protein